MSLPERLIRQVFAVVKLKTQHRSNPHIMSFSNREFYNNELISGPTIIRPLAETCPRLGDTVKGCFGYQKKDHFSEERLRTPVVLIENSIAHTNPSTAK